MELKWTPELATGVAEVDQQHQRLIESLARLIGALKRGQGSSEVNKTLEFLGRYAAEHFAFEEGCMERHRCPAALANKLAHQKFLRIFTDFRARVEKEGVSPALAIEVQRQLSDWLMSHIRQTDTQLRPCVGTNASRAVA